MSVSAIVLAGGRSSRFGRDKLAAPLDGRPLIAHAVEAVDAVADEIIVVLAPDAPEPSPLGAAVRVTRDPEPFGGPLVGLVAGLEAATCEHVLVVAGDMPTLDPAVLRLLLEGLATAQAAALVEAGAIRPLPSAFVRARASHDGHRLVESGERRLRSLLDELGVRSIPEEKWRSLDPDAATLRDVDLPSDMPA